MEETSDFSRTIEAFLFLEDGEAINSDELVGWVMLIDLLLGFATALSTEFNGIGSEVVLETCTSKERR